MCEGDPPLTEEQRALVRTRHSTYAEACPGAGKTHTIVQRFIQRPGACPRRGVALLSFTNAVVEEARSCCAGQPELLRVPNFVGTIDAFINRFLVAPVFVARTGVSPTFRDTWSTVPRSSFRVSSVPKMEVTLDCFAFDLDGNARLTPSRISDPKRRAAASNLWAWQRKDLEAEARARWRWNIERGVLDAEASRLHLGGYLADGPTRHKLADLMGARFAEVIVDEVQDCCREDVRVLELLREAGVRLVMVGDPDQSIYGFRGGGHAGLGQLVASVRQGPRMDGNFRSAPAICKTVDSLRHGDTEDRPVGAHRVVNHPVFLVPYHDLSTVSDSVSRIIEQVGIHRDEVVVLAHAAKHARQCVGAAGAPNTTSASKLVRIAAAVHHLQDRTGAARKRTGSLRALHGLLRELGDKNLADLSENEYAEHIGLTPRAVLERCLRLATALDPPYLNKPSEFKKQLASQGQSQRELGWSPRALRAPNNDVWEDNAGGGEGAFAHSTIHGYKGLQSLAVVLVIPKRAKGEGDDDGVQAWHDHRASEARRVLYVGASRAQKLLIVAAHDTVVDPVQTALARDGVPLVGIDVNER